MIFKKISLKNYNTMGVDAIADNFVFLKNILQLKEIENELQDKKVIVIGSGSNVLFTQNFNGLILKNELDGINIISEDDESVKVNVGAGIVWNDFVEYAIRKNWSGIENLVLIPGTVGAAPIQNIGAYGHEVKDAIVSVNFYDISKKEFFNYSKLECQFSYRNSIFKSQLKNNCIITSVAFELKKSFKPCLSYPAIKDFFKVHKGEIKINDISNAIKSIRKSKLPDFNKLGNCGSFFMNPFLNKTDFILFNNKFPDSPYYKSGEGFKLSAGWLIEQCGWKGKRIGNVGCYDLHALVIVNYGGATGKEVLDFSDKIICSVNNKFGIKLKREVNII